MSHSEIIHKKFSTFFRKGGEGYSEGMCKKESFLCGNKVIIYTIDDNSITSWLYILIHPCDTFLPIEEGLFVPCIP
jgi:hypothetical protein